MRLKGIKDYDSANKYLKEEFLLWYNKNYTLVTQSDYKELPKEIELQEVFSIKHPRKVNKDNTISYRGTIYQLLPLNGIKSFANQWIEVCELPDGKVNLLYENKKIAYVVLTKKDYKSLKQEEILNKTRYVPVENKKRKNIPAQNHPWRKPWKLKNVTFQT